MKPPFRLPTMGDVHSATPNGLIVASTFSGCGGSSAGYRLAGFRVVYANDIESHARATYAANHPGTPIDERDIRRVTGADVIAMAGCVPDVVELSPPCQPYSAMGNGRGMRDPRDRLFDGIRLLGELMPRAFTLENVPPLALDARHRPTFDLAMRRTRDLGYTVEARILDAHRLGVPQERRRLIVIGIRADLGIAPRFPQPTPWVYGVGDALPHVEHVVGHEYYKPIYRPAALPMPTIGAAERPFRAKLRDGTRRKFTIDEVKALCGFPPDFALGGSYAQQHARLGNAVPIPLAHAIASVVRDALQGTSQGSVRPVHDPIRGGGF